MYPSPLVDMRGQGWWCLAACNISPLPHELEKRAGNGHAVVRDGRPLHGVGVQLVAKDSDRVPVEEHLGDDLVCELGVALHADVSAGGVEGLNFADRVGAEGDRVGGEFGDDVAVHLVDALCRNR